MTDKKPETPDNHIVPEEKRAPRIQNDVDAPAPDIVDASRRPGFWFRGGLIGLAIIIALILIVTSFNPA